MVRFLSFSFICLHVKDDTRALRTLDTLGFSKEDSPFVSNADINFKLIPTPSLEKEVHAPYFGIEVDHLKSAIDYLSAIGIKQKGICTLSDTIGYPIYQGFAGIDICLTEKIKTEASSRYNFQTIDHLAFAVDQGHTNLYADFLTTVLKLERQKTFHIKGDSTYFQTTPFISDNQKIKIVLSESTDPSSQIAYFLKKYHGEGLQHIAFSVESIKESVQDLRNSGVIFQEISDHYYFDLPNRLKNHEKDLTDYHREKILLDGDDEERHYLSQIFTKPLFPPLFFELIEREGAKGFGEGNITALFKSVEKDLHKNINKN